MKLGQLSKFLGVGFLITLIVLFQNCSQDNYKIGITRQGSSSTNQGNNVPDPDPSGPTLHQNSFTVPSHAVDVLVVDDNSGSMTTEQSNMGDRFPQFITSLAGFDWQLGITTTDMEIDNKTSNDYRQNGRLLPFSDNVYVINNQTQNAEQLFLDTVQRPAGEGDGDERGIYAAYKAIDRNDKNLFRPVVNGASPVLAIIILSDEDERSSGGQDVDKPLELEDEPETLINLVKQKWQDKKQLLINSIIVRPGDTACYNTQGYFKDDGTWKQEGKYGTIYDLATTLTNGILGNICADDYSAQLQSMGDRILQTVDTFTLDCQPVNGQFTYKINGVLGNSSNATLNDKNVKLSPAPSSGAVVDFQYYCN